MTVKRVHADACRLDTYPERSRYRRCACRGDGPCRRRFVFVGASRAATEPIAVARGRGQRHRQFPVAENVPYTLGGMIFCITRPGTVTITKVAPYRPSGGLVVQDFAFVPDPYQAGGSTFYEQQGSIAQFSEQSSPYHLQDSVDRASTSRVCPRDPNAPTPPGLDDMLYVQVARVTSQTASDKGIVVSYTSGGRHFADVFDWTSRLCVEGDPVCPH